MFNNRHLGDTQSGKWQRVIRPQLHPYVQRAFDGTKCDQRLLTGSTFRFGEALFSPTAVDELTSYEPEMTDLGAHMLSFCFLPEGQWKLRVSGKLQFISAEGVLFVTQSGNKICDVPIKASDGKLSVEFDYRQKRHEDPFSVFISGWQRSAIDPLREGAIELEAVYSE
jgi:hypothetical protein